MNNKYFIVPVTASLLKIDGMSLFKILETIDYELAKREKTRKEIRYSSKKSATLKLNEILFFEEEHNKKTSMLFKEKGLPEKLVLVKTGEELKELATNVSVEILNEEFLNPFEVTGEDIVDYFVVNKEYEDEAIRLIDAFMEKKKVLIKKI